MLDKKVLIFGAGKIGRGFVADLFRNGGYGINFVDADEALIQQLKTRKSYTVYKMRGEGDQDTVQISGFNAFSLSETSAITSQLAGCTYAAIAVFPGAFESIAACIAPEIERRASTAGLPLDIILCANVLNPSKTFGELLEAQLSDTGKAFLESSVGLVESLVIRICIEPSAEMKQQDPLVVLTNGYPELTLDGAAFKSRPPVFDGVILAKNFHAEEVRKIYTYNMLHAVYAYLGKLKGYSSVLDCIKDPEIMTNGRGALDEVARALQCEYGYTAEEMAVWNNRVVKNLSNPILADTVERLGGNPIRKLKREDRLTGPMILCHNNGIMPYYLAKVVACAFLFDPAKDDAATEIRRHVQNYGIRESIVKYCELDKELELVQLAVDFFRKISESRSLAENSDHVNKIKQAWEGGFRYEKVYKGCAQCTLQSMFDVTGKRNESLYQAASGLSGGMGLCGEGSCGGYTGGILQMGSYAGRRMEFLDAGGDKDAQYKSYTMGMALHDKFIECYGAVTCREIHRSILGRSYCLRTKPVRTDFEAAGAHKNKCTNVIAASCAWVTELMIQEKMI